MVRPFFQARGAFRLGAGGCDHARAEQFRHLDRGNADPAGRPVHQHPLARRQPAALQQRVISGGVGATEDTRRLQAHAIGDLVAQSGLGIAAFSAGAESVPAHDAVPNLETGDTRTNGDHQAGSLTAGDERRVRTELVCSGQHQHIDILHAARGDLHLDFVGGWRWRVRDITPGQHLGATKRLTHYCLHCFPHRYCRNTWQIFYP